MSTTTLPKPFSAYVGLLASTVGGAADTVRHPTSVTRLPLLAVSSILMARERYDEMAERGELVLQGVLSRFGGSSSPEARRGSGARSTFDQVQGRAAARVADAGDHLEEHAGAVVTRLHDAAEQASRAGQRVVGGPGTPLGTGARAAASAAGRAAERVEKAADVVRPPSPVENMSTEVAAPPTTDRGAIDDAPPAGGPNPAESSTLRAVADAVATEAGQAAAAMTSTPDPRADMAAEPAAPPTTDRGAIDDAPAAADAPIPPAARKAAAKKARKASPRPAAKKAAAPAKKAVPAAKKAAPGTKPTAPAPALAQEAAGSATAASTDAPRGTGPTPAVPPALLTPPPPTAVTPPIATAATVPSPIATVPSPTPPTATPSKTSKTSAPAAGPSTTSEAAPAPVVPAGHTDGLVVPAAVKEAAGPLRGHANLPLADFDHMTMGSLRGRLRTLDAASLVQLLDYEQAHGSRLPILTLLQNRLRRVLAD